MKGLALQKLGSQSKRFEKNVSGFTFCFLGSLLKKTDIQLFEGKLLDQNALDRIRNKIKLSVEENDIIFPKRILLFERFLNKYGDSKIHLQSKNTLRKTFFNQIY